MNSIDVIPQILLIVENPEHLSCATTALANWGHCEWSNARDCAAAVEWLHVHPAHLVIVLLQSGNVSGLAHLRQSWHGSLICFCDDDESTVHAVEDAQGLAILPPFVARQIRSALTYALSQPTSLKLSTLKVSHHIHIEQALRESEQRLAQAQRMEVMGQLAGGITHDFNNLLTVIGSYGDLAMRRLEEGHPVRLYVEQIRKASAMATTLTRQLLNLNRRQELHPRPFVLNEVVDEISMMVKSLLGAGIELRIRLDPELGQIEADPGQLQQVLLNLIVNARDAMPDGGLLNIETCNCEIDTHFARHYLNMQPGSYVRLSVTDTGVGIDRETMAHIYEPFFTTKPKGSGTGLGLPTVYSIVQQYGGCIRVHSEVGQATNFRIYLPRVDRISETKAAETKQREPETVQPLRGRETILLVEHERAAREFAAAILQEAGYRVLVAGSHSEASALESSYGGEIDVLITDMLMPKIFACEGTIQLLSRRPSVRVIYASNYAQEVLAFKQLLDSSALWVEKPFCPSDLLCVMRQAIEQAPGFRRSPLSFKQSPLINPVNLAL